MQVYILDKVENNPLEINGHPGEFAHLLRHLLLARHTRHAINALRLGSCMVRYGRQGVSCRGACQCMEWSTISP